MVQCHKESRIARLNTPVAINLVLSCEILGSGFMSAVVSILAHTSIKYNNLSLSGSPLAPSSLDDGYLFRARIVVLCCATLTLDATLDFFLLLQITHPRLQFHSLHFLPLGLRRPRRSVAARTSQWLRFSLSFGFIIWLFIRDDTQSLECSFPNCH